jgi:hypothetical protein
MFKKNPLYPMSLSEMIGDLKENKWRARIIKLPFPYPSVSYKVEQKEGWFKKKVVIKKGSCLYTAVGLVAEAGLEFTDGTIEKELNRINVVDDNTKEIGNWIVNKGTPRQYYYLLEWLLANILCPCPKVEEGATGKEIFEYVLQTEDGADRIVSHMEQMNKKFNLGIKFDFDSFAPDKVSYRRDMENGNLEHFPKERFKINV